MHPILKDTPNVTDLVLAMDIWSSDSTSGLCRGLSLINPRRVIMRHSGGKTRINKATTDLTANVLKCLPEWSNLESTVCDIGTYGHIKTFADSLARSKTIRTLLFPSSVFSRHSLPSLCRFQSLKVVQITSKLGPFDMQYKAEVDAGPKLGKLIKYTVKTKRDAQTAFPVIFKLTLALPYLFRCLTIRDSPAAVESLRQQLISIPALGSSIRRIYLSIHMGFPEDISSILSCADRVEIVKGRPLGQMRRQDLDRPEDRNTIKLFSFKIQLHLAKSLITCPGYLIHLLSKDHEPRWDSFFQDFEKDIIIPGLREIQVSWCVASERMGDCEERLGPAGGDAAFEGN
ncbi:hypothetical protein C8J57DRAFT_1515114 [Mycena rebaudengoi]|nr:hypothetical protein C8J57DRAFT_1515114 [Mycena rebaudengoi]